MMALDLPVIAPKATIAEAMSAMKAFDRAAAVVAKAGGAIVVTLSDALDARSHAAESDRRCAGELELHGSDHDRPHHNVHAH